MRRRRAVVGLVALALAAGVIVAIWPRGPRPCRETFEQVRTGMTYDEGCATVGAPPGVYSRRPDYPISMSGGPEISHETWVAADSTLHVAFDTEADRAVVMGIYDPPPDPRSFFQRLRARLGL
jgi:hypothetical protein